MGHTNDCLCHGLAGNAETLLEASRVLDGEQARRAEGLVQRAAGVLARRELGGALSYDAGEGECPPLMVGSTGTGLFLLRVADRSVASVLLPRP